MEGGTPNTLLRRGLTRDILTIGTEIIVDGYQTKDHSLKRANGRDVTFTDGQKIFMGSSGTGAPSDGRDPTETVPEAAGVIREGDWLQATGCATASSWRAAVRALEGSAAARC